MGRGWYSTGFQQEATSDLQKRVMQLSEREIAEAIREHKHYWVAIVMYKVTPPLVDGSILDVENLRSIPAVGCFICEKIYGEAGLGSRCKGEPR